LRGDAADPSAIADALATFDLATLATRAVRTLSAGQRRRAALARVVAADANLWLLDEPLNALDKASQDALAVILDTWLGEGGLVIAATHAALATRRAGTLELGTPR
jgi:heme exporter protein A